MDHDDEQYPRKEVEEFFDEMDRYFDGRLSFAEFMGEETPLEKLFKSMDKDGDGTVTKEVRRLVLEFQMMSEFLCSFPKKESKLCGRIYVCTMICSLYFLFLVRNSGY